MCHLLLSKRMEDNIDQIVPTTDSARRVVELVKKYGKKYVAGELSADRGLALTGSEIPTICSENRFEDASTCFFNKLYGTLPNNNHNPLNHHFKARRT